MMGMINVSDMIYIFWNMKKVDYKVALGYPCPTLGGVLSGGKCTMLT